MKDRNSVLHIVLVVVLMAATVVGAASAVAIVVLNNRALQQQEEIEARMRIDNYALMLTSLMHAADFSGLVETTALIVADPSLLRVDVKSYSGRIIATAGEEPAAGDGTDLLTYPVYLEENDGEPLGTLEFRVQYLQVRLLQFDWRTLGPVVLALCAMGAVLFWMLKLRVVAPIERLGKAALDYSGEGPWPLRDLRGPTEIVNLNCSLAEMTEQLSKRTRELRSQIAETAETHQKFVAAQKREIVGTIAGGISHDFNNILAIILGNAELMKLEPAPEKFDERVDIIIESAGRASALSHKMLAFAQKSELRPSVLDLNRVITRLNNWISRTIPKNIAVKTSLKPGLWQIHVDESSVESALLNLIVNAQHAMPEGGEITITTENTTLAEQIDGLPAGRYVLLQVADTGVGVATKNLEKIFDPFFTTRPPGEGSGLGLSMVIGFMKQSGGTVRVQSEEGQGACFRLFFPISEASLETEAEPETATIHHGDARILIAEDEADLARILQQHLESAGYRVRAFGTADAAWSEFRNTPDYDLLVTDMVMPGNLQGVQLAGKIRTIRPETPVIFISGYSRDSHLSGEVQASDRKLAKPVSRQVLLSAVSAALRQKRAGQ